MKRKTFLLIGSIVVVIFFSCRDQLTENEEFISEADFLLDSHNTWTYTFYDSLSKERDTVVIKPLGKTLYDKRTPAFIWQLKFKKYTDTNYVFVSANKDTIRFLPNFYGHNRYVKTRMLLPLSVGMKWKGEWFNDTVRVLRTEKISLSYKTFLNAFYLEERWGALNDYGQMVLWYQPNVGFLKIYRREWGFGFLNQTWELLKFEKD